MSEQRLERIEDKVDKLVDSMTLLVRLEEKFQAHSHGVQRLSKRIEQLEKDSEAIKKILPLLNIILSVFGRVGITIIVLVITGLIGSHFIA